MLGNKRLNIILALIIAIGLWAYVIGNTNPEDEQTFREIPIELVNEETLTEQNLAVLNTSANMMSVTLKGKRADINRITGKDITATVDLSDAGLGESQLKIVLRTPDNVEIIDQSLNRITVVVEERVSKEVDIVTDYEGTFANDQEPITVEMSRNSVAVTGAKSLVEQVASVRAKVPEGEVSDELRTVSAEILPVNAEGKEVKNLQMSVNKIEVTTELATTKTVNLEVPVVDNSDQSVEKQIDVPKTITIKGGSSALADISVITAEEIDLTNVTKNKVINIIPVLPDGVQVSSKSAGTLKLEVTVAEMERASFSFRGSDVELSGLADTLNADVDDISIDVTVSGSKAQIDAISEGDFLLTADLSDLEEGNHQVVLNITCDKDYAGLNFDPEEIDVTITRE
ncbi:MAG: hypothetical protein U0M21_05300 [Emergencia sp.]|nr:hypothetical protein [Emergencia sp.]